MTAPDPIAPPREFAFSDADFRMIADAVRRWAGIDLSENKKSLVYSRLAKRLRSLGMTDFTRYCDFVFGEDGAEERDHLLTALTTNVTRFFREPHHFEQLRTEALPPLIARARSGGRVRIWSAGCSTGQEPYSIAITILDSYPDAPSKDLRLLATDIDGGALTEAQAGTYAAGARGGLTAEQEAKHFTTLGGDTRSVAPRPRSLVAFRRLNLMEDWPLRGPFDIIFCRNTAIYFDRDTQARLWQRFAEKLAPGGWLFIGHSERIAGPAGRLLTPAGITSYRRHAAPTE